MKKLISLIISLIVIILSLTLIFSKKQDMSEDENRYLEKFPKLSFQNVISTKYMQSMNNYLIDHFPLRKKFISLKTFIDKKIGKKIINNVYFTDDYLIDNYSKLENIDKIINNLNDFYKQINYLNVELMLVPNSISINKDKLPFNINDDLYNDLYTIYDGIKFSKINVYDTLKDNNDKYDMYYHLDHHWTTYAAYYAYLEYCKTNNIKPIMINEYNIKKVSSSFRGTTYSKVLDNSYKSDDIYIFDYNGDYVVNKDDDIINLYDYDKLNGKDKYAVFLGGNYPIITVTNKKIEKKELVIIKDSYANSLIPFLANHFYKIHVIDPRYYNDSIISYIKDNNIMDVLIIFNMNNLNNYINLY